MRLSWDEYFMKIAEQASARATCNRGRTAAVIVKSNNILSSGYVGSPPGAPHCDDVGHDLQVSIEDGESKTHCVRTTHAEINAICNAAKRGIALDGATIYCLLSPCYSCAKAVVSVGIKRVVAKHGYQSGAESIKLFEICGVEYEVIDDTVFEYGGDTGKIK